MVKFDRWTVGQVLARARENVGLTQFELADIVGVSRRMVSHWETGRLFPRIKNIVKFATACNVKPSKLLYRIGLAIEAQK